MMINLDFIYPIGTIYETTSTVHPNILFGGTWELYGAGRVTVCRDSSQDEFNTIGKTGGSKYLQQHHHQRWCEWREYANNTYGLTDSIFYSGNHAANTGAYIPSGNVDGITTGDSGNLQPYIVVYRYRRVA